MSSSCSSSSSSKSSSSSSRSSVYTQTVIIRPPYGFRDERLYPPGWRSFSQIFVGVNFFEISADMISFNAIEQEIIREMIAINELISETAFNSAEIISVNAIGEISDKISEIIGYNALEELSGKIVEIIGYNALEELSGKIVEIIGYNALELSGKINEVISYNVIEQLFYTNEIISNNVLARDLISEIISKNVIQIRNIYGQEYTGINRLDEEVSFDEYSHSINVFVDDINVTDHIEKWEIMISDDNYTNTGSVTFVDETYYGLCDPLLNLGEKRIKIVIDDIIYEFLLEKRSPEESSRNVSFSIWGRSLIAILELPYSIPVIDKEVVQNMETLEWSCPSDPDYIPHFWQTENRLASEIIEYLAGDLTVSFLIDDFVVKKEDFVTTGESPLELINKLASVIGGYIRTDLDDTVIIKYHKFNTEGTINVSLIDHENILLLNETEDLPEGYNKILVRGTKDSTPEQNAELEIELDEERNEERTEFNFTEDIWLRVYRTPFDINYYYTTSLGELTLVTENIAETIEREESEFVERTLTTNHPIDTIISIEKYDCSEVLPIEYSFERGYKYITTNEDVDTENEPVLISYSTKYDLYKLNVTQPCDPLIFEEVISRITVIQI